jgi:Transposase DDE domain
VVPLCGYRHTRKGRCTGIPFVDATSLAVCHNRRISRHKVFEGYATRGKSSMGWYFGFKLPLMINDEGELLACRVTTAEVNDQGPVGRMARGLWGQLLGDRGSISRALQQALWAQGLAWITLLRRNMKPRLMRLWDRRRLRKRFLIETVNDQLKNVSQIEHTYFAPCRVCKVCARGYCAVCAPRHHHG